MTSIADNQAKVERVDDIPVIYGMLERMGIQGIVDGAIKAHGKWQGLSPGQVITVWRVHILSTQTHKMEPVQQGVGRRLHLLETLTGVAVSELDFTDDRLAMCLRDLSKLSAWHAIEEAIGRRLLRVYDHPLATRRTTFHHADWVYSRLCADFGHPWPSACALFCSPVRLNQDDVCPLTPFGW